MATLLFNSNYLLVTLPPKSHPIILNQPDTIYRLRCIYDFWPVSDLLQEWGVDDFPKPDPKWAVIFIAAPNDLETLNDEEYEITLHPLSADLLPITVQCIADADRLFFGVGMEEESPFGYSNLSHGEAWLQVKIKCNPPFSENETSEDGEISADLVINGETQVNWTVADIESIVI